MENSFSWPRAITKTARKAALPVMAAGSVECAVQVEFQLSPAWRPGECAPRDPHSHEEPRAEEPAITWTVGSSSTTQLPGITGRADIQLPMITATLHGTVTG